MINFSEKTHTYTVDDNVVPSVTQIIQWALNIDLSNIPIDLLDRAINWGKAVHSATQQYDWGLGCSSEQLKPSVDAWADFVKDYEIIDIEKPYYADGFAGTIDRVLRKGSNIYIVDIKTSTTLRRHYGLQLSAYAYLYGQNNNTAWDDMTLLVVQIDQHGGIKVKEYQNEWFIFKAMRDVYQWDHKYKRRSE